MYVEINSFDNDKIKKVIKLISNKKTRKEEKAFVVEGIKLVKEAIKYAKVKEIFCTKNIYNEFNFLKKIDNVYIVSDKCFQKMSETKTPQGILATIEIKERTKEEIYKENTFIIYLDSINDPGNLGTIIRTGEAVGVTGIIASSDTVDIYNPKTIRASMGSIFRIPFIYSNSLIEELKFAKSKKISTYAMELKNSNDYTENDYKKSIGIIIGNEANGIKKEIIEVAEKTIKIPMQGSVESLNAAVAMSVISFEVAKQRKK